MIEALVDYIQKKGFQVVVFAHRLFFYKDSAGGRYGYSWMISEVDLKYAYPETLYAEADYYLAEVERAMRTPALRS